MADVDLGLKRPEPFTIETLDKLLVVMGEVYICTIPTTITPITQATMLYCCVYLALLVMLMIVFMKMTEVIVGVMVQDLEVCLKRSANINFTMPKEVLMIIVEVDTVLRTSPLPPIIHVIFVNHWVL